MAKSAAARPGAQARAEDAAGDGPREQRRGRMEGQVRQVIAGGVPLVEESIDRKRDDNEGPEVLDREIVRSPPRASQVDGQHPAAREGLAQLRGLHHVVVVVGDEGREESRQDRRNGQRDENRAATCAPGATPPVTDSPWPKAPAIRPTIAGRSVRCQGSAPRPARTRAGEARDARLSCRSRCPPDSSSRSPCTSRSTPPSLRRSRPSRRC